MVSELAREAPARLEVGPGPWPKLPVEGTHVVDLSAPALEVLAARGAIAHVGTLAEAKFPDASFDLVGMFEVIEHLDDDVALLSEAARVTKPGGRLILSVPLGMKYWSALDDYVGHVRRYEPEELRARVEGAGFVVERIASLPYLGGSSAFAGVYAGLMRAFPRVMMWLTERLIAPAVEKKIALSWSGPETWDERMKGAVDCTLVCRRA